MKSQNVDWKWSLRRFRTGKSLWNGEFHNCNPRSSNCN